MRCPSCQVAVPHTASVEGLAQCPDCGHVWEVDATMRADPGSPPPGCHRRRLQDGSIELELDWNHHWGALIHMLLPMAALPILTAPSLTALGMSAVIGTLWFAGYRNTTTVRIDPAGVSVAHGPVPDPVAFSGHIDAWALADLHVRTRMENRVFRLRYQDVEHYSLRAGSRTLLLFWPERAILDYVQACIEATVEVPSAPPEPASPWLPAVPVPEGVEATLLPDDEGVELALPWNAHGSPVAVHLLLLLVPIAIGGGGLMNVAVAAGIVALWLYLWQNTTRVRVTRTGIEVRHGPLHAPFYADVQMPTPAELTVDQVRLPSGAWHAYHTLRAGPTTLLAHWLDRTKLEYVQATIERARSIPDADATAHHAAAKAQRTAMATVRD